jgi:hypothetical protein
MNPGDAPAPSTGRAGFCLSGQLSTARVFVPPCEPECVRLALADLCGDVERITGRSPALVGGIEQADVVIASVDRVESAGYVHRLDADLAPGLSGRWEAYRVCTVGARLVIAGSDERGTMFGIYAFIEEYLGVDPLWFWASRPPQKRGTLQWDRVGLTSDGPSFRFRGWFINDEDLLTEWKSGGGRRNIDYRYYSQVIAPEVIRAVVEALVRSRCNLIIPASFVDIMNPPEEALVRECARRGVFVSQHHIEPMGVSAFSYFNYWKARGRELTYSYFKHPAEMRDVWRAYAGRWAAYPNIIWQVGLRGIADRPMWQADESTPRSDAERGRLISEAMEDQLQILESVLGRRPQHYSTTLWAEGAVLHQQGKLRLPAGAIVVFSDNSPGWRWQKDFFETPRNPQNRYGVYYHLGLISSGPHLAQVTPPERVHASLNEAVSRRACDYVMLNVANIREFVLGLGVASQTAWRHDEVQPEAWMARWVGDRFSRGPERILEAYRLYFESWQIHDTRQVPFLMDGQMFLLGSSTLEEIETLLSGKGAGPGDDPEDAPPGDSAGDAFWDSLRDMFPPDLGRQENVRRAGRQRLALLRARELAEAAAEELPVHEREFLADQLVHQAAIMEQVSTWLEGVLAARIALDAMALSPCLRALEIAESALVEIERLAGGYCRGIWEHWYRGCRKLDIAAALSRTREALVQAQALARAQGMGGA